MAADAREAALEVLTSCRKADAWADGALKAVSARSGLLPRDAALAARITYTVLQNRMLLDYYIRRLCKNPDLEPIVLDILRIGACQILMMDRIPVSAAVNSAVELAKSHRRARAAGMINAVLRNLDRSRDKLAPPEDLSIRFSHPKWLTDRCAAILGQEEAARFLAANNVPVPTTIQRNRLLCGREQLLESLSEVCLTPHPWLEDCYEISGTGNLEQLPAFQKGFFLVQDAAAALVPLAAGCRPGMTVLDVCAAPGGKSFGAAMAMGGDGLVIARDIHPHKLRLIEASAKRLGIACVRTECSDARQADASLARSADVVICDVPCSGLGIIRKKPDIRYKDPAALAGLPAVQRRILSASAEAVKPGGCLVYSTCTILPEENRQVVDWFLSEDRRFALEPFSLPSPAGDTEGDLTLWPQRHQTDGFYICKLRRIHD